METLELPVVEIEDAPPVDFSEDEMDQAAFKLWQEASRLDEPEDLNR
jgi:hypothetical protein